jgi:aryl-alcohol dehydrogenase-like predicted oxidoreductase
MDHRTLGRTDLRIAPLVFGGNVFGWTADEATSFRLLDAFVDHGFDAIDTADVYSAWVPGHQGGESEAIIGRWFAANPGKRDKVSIFTKVGSDLGEGRKGLSARWIAKAAEDSLRRLQTDRIDLYFSHWPDSETPYEETLGAYEALRAAGKIRHVGASNLDAAQLEAALAVSAAKGLPRYDVLQPEYNLYDRASFEGPLRDLVQREEIGVVTYFSLASGFLSGKYRSEADLAGSRRGDAVKKYLNARGQRILDALDEVAGAHGARPAEVALAWVMASPGVTAPIASATSTEQLASLAGAAELRLSTEQKARLDAAGDTASQDGNRP